MTGCIISYSHVDAKFADKLRDRLVAEGGNVWLDRHDMVAGPMQDQVWRVIRVHHAVILIVCESSVESGWVENELGMAHRKEKPEKGTVLHPVALNDARKAKPDARAGPGESKRALWPTLNDKPVVDFSRRRTVPFDRAFAKLQKVADQLWAERGGDIVSNPAPHTNPSVINRSRSHSVAFRCLHRPAG